jgi:hypothetical protein
MSALRVLLKGDIQHMQWPFVSLVAATQSSNNLMLSKVIFGGNPAYGNHAPGSTPRTHARAPRTSHAVRQEGPRAFSEQFKQTMQVHVISDGTPTQRS